MQMSADEPHIHSWERIWEADSDVIHKLLPPPPQLVGGIPGEGMLINSTAAVHDFVEAIEHGELDSWLEAILAAGHNRKRALRGVRGFPGLRRER